MRFIPAVSPVQIQVPLPDPKDGTCRLLGLSFGKGPRPAWATWPVGQVVKTPPFHGGNTSSSLVRVTKYGGVAQPVEHLLHTQGVTDSSSVVSTNKKDIRKDVLFVLPGAYLKYITDRCTCPCNFFEKTKKGGNKIPQLASKTIESMRKTARSGSRRKSSEKERGLYYAFVTKPAKRLTVGGWSCILCM